MKKELSFIIPLKISSEKIPELTKRINSLCKNLGISYEIIFIAKNVKEDTEYIIRTLSMLYPVTLFKRENISLLEAILTVFKDLKYSNIGLIEGNFSFTKINLEEAVVGLKKYDASIVYLKEEEGKTYKDIFDSLNRFLLNRETTDNLTIKTKIKIFKKEFFEKVYLNSSSWILEENSSQKLESNGFKIHEEVLTSPTINPLGNFSVARDIRTKSINFIYNFVRKLWNGKIKSMDKLKSNWEEVNILKNSNLNP